MATLHDLLLELVFDTSPDQPTMYYGYGTDLLI